MFTFLDLCRELVSEVGVSGGTGPSSVEGQTGKLARIVRWVRDADMAVELKWSNWKFLWAPHTATVHEDIAEVDGPSDFSMRHYDRKQFWLDKTTNTKKLLTFKSWPDFNGKYNVGELLNVAPTVITVRPDGVLLLNTLPDKDYTLSAEGWRRPVPMSEDDDVPLIPEDFYRVIIARAKIFYGSFEDAPEILADGEAEFTDMMDNLASSELPGQETDRMSQSDVDEAVDVDYDGT